MKKILLMVALLGLSNLAFAEWESGCSGYSSGKYPNVDVPHLDTTGRIHSNVKIPQRLIDQKKYERWTYLDENGYDYTVTIKVIK